MSTQPVGYYINAVKIMLHLAKEEMEESTFEKDAVSLYVTNLNEQKKDLRFSEIFDEIDQTISLMYEYAKNKGFIESNTTFADFVTSFTDKNWLPH